MKLQKIIFLLSMVPLTFAITACDKVAPEPATILNYTKPEVSGLAPERAFPNPDDVCQLLGPSDFTKPLEADGRRLIACPKHEKDAIKERRRAGARVVANATHWVIMSVADWRI